MATPEENIKRYKARLAGLKRAKRFIDWRETRAFVGQLEDLLADLRAGCEDPNVGVELAARFFECDQAVFERCDDSSGMVGDVFRATACDLFVHYAVSCTDKDKLAERLYALYEQDDYGVRDCLLGVAHQFLPEAALRALVERFWRAWEAAPRDRFGGSRWTSGIEIIARQLQDAPLFEKAQLAGWPELSAAGCQDIARAYLEAGDAATALSWMQRVPDGETFRADEGDRLLLAIYEKLEDDEQRVATAWRLFHRSRSADRLETLLAIIGEDRRDQVIADEAQDILSAEPFSYEDAAFLLQTGQMDAAEDYLLRRADQLDGNLYTYILPMAEALEENDRWLVASVLYRALLESILRKAQSRYYHHGIRYLKKLDELSAEIADWRDVQSHEQYKVSLQDEHGRKSSFWSKYQN